MSTHHPNFKRSSGFGSVFKSWTNSLKTTTATNVPVQINPTVVGGGTNQQKIFSQLKSGSLPSRASAAAKMTESLQKYTISSIPEVWYLARDMCDTKVQPQIRRTALKLLIECIKCDDFSLTGSVLMYYRDIVHFCQLSDNKIDQEYDLFLKALRCLTQEGREISDVCLFDIGRNLPQFLSVALTVLGKNAKNYTPATSVEELQNDQTYQSLVKTIQYLQKCFKFNAYDIDQSSAITLARQIITIGYSTSNSNLTKHCIEFLTTVLMYNSISNEIINEVIHFYCYSTYQSRELVELTWNSIVSIANESNYFIINSCIGDVLTNDDIKSNPTSDFDLTTVISNVTSGSSQPVKHIVVDSCIGALSILEKIITTSYMTKDGQDAKLAFFLESLIKMLNFNVPVLNTALLAFFDRLFAKNLDNSKIELSIHDYNQQIFSFQLWFSTKHSIYSLLKAIKISTEEDANYWKSICEALQSAYERQDLQTPKERLVDLFFTHYAHLPMASVRFILDYFSEEKLCSTLSPLWKDSSMKILNYFFYEATSGPKSWFSFKRSVEDETDIKSAVLSTISKSLEVSYCLDNSLIDYDVVFEVFKSSVGERNRVVLANLFETLFVDNISHFTSENLENFLDLFKPYFSVNAKSSKYRVLKSTGDPFSLQKSKPSATMSVEFLEEMTKATLKAFLIESTEDPQKCQQLYDFVTQVAKYSLWQDQGKNLLAIAKCLCRIRLCQSGNVYFSAPEDLGGLAAAFRRSKYEADFEHSPEFEWVYPEHPEFLPEQYFERPHPKLTVENSTVAHEMVTLKLDFWFQLVLDVMDNFVSFEVYSFMWAHFCTQLSNLTLFMNNMDEILELKNVVCQQLTLNLPAKLKLPGDVLKSDLQVAFVRTISALLGYHKFFSKYDEDDIIRALLFGIDSWERTAIPCIHILTICCYEIPLSIKKFLSVILTKLQTRISGTFASSHILEFLMNLINLPALTSNFNMDEVKRIFGISFKFIEHSNDAIKKLDSSKDDTADKVAKHGADAATDQTPSTNVSSEHLPTLLQYVLTLSYNVISTWFLQINLNERKQLSSFIIKNLIALNSNKKVLDLQTISFLDLVVRFTFNDLPLKIINPNLITEKFKQNDSNISSSKWVLGSSIISVDTKSVTGDSLIMIRRPTGVSIFHLNLDPTLVPPNSQHSTIISSPHYLLQCFNHLDTSNKSKPIPLLDDSITSRALSTFDRVPIVEFHKIGVVYIGPNQHEEGEVLRNNNGSKDYQTFLENLGEVVRLKGCKNIYTGGLDVENDSDGQFAIYWTDKTIQVIYHITTLMKNNEKDIYFDLKKRHIGNNYVNIYYDESGLSFNFNLIKSQFNFINIVISPHTKNHHRNAGKIEGPRFYKIKTLRRIGVPGVFATCHFKIISEEKLAIAVRNLAITANQFANVWHAKQGYTSNWVHRAKQIAIIKERTVQTHQSLRQEQHETETAGLNATQSFLEQLEYSGSASTTNNRYEYLTEADTELYRCVEFNSYS